MDLQDSTKTKWEIHKAKGSAEEKEAALQQFVNLMWGRYSDMLQEFASNNFDPSDMFMVKSLGDEIWLHLAATADPENGGAILRVLMDSTWADFATEASAVLAHAIPSGGLPWKMTLDVVDEFIDCGKLAVESVRPPLRPKDGLTYGSPFEKLSEAEKARLLERLAVCIRVKDDETREDVFAYRIDPVGWQVDRFHRLKNVCRKGHEGKIVVGSEFMKQFFPKALAQQPDANDAIRWSDGNSQLDHEYEGVRDEETFKGFDEPYTYYYVRKV
jgi:hypothetical protein